MQRNQEDQDAKEDEEDEAEYSTKRTKIGRGANCKGGGYVIFACQPTRFLLKLWVFIYLRNPFKTRK